MPEKNTALNSKMRQAAMLLGQGYQVMEAAEMICRIVKIKHVQELQNIEAKERNRMIRELKAAGLSIRQIERLTGMNRGIVFRA